MGSPWWSWWNRWGWSSWGFCSRVICTHYLSCPLGKTNKQKEQPKNKPKTSLNEFRIFVSLRECTYVPMESMASLHWHSNWWFLENSKSYCKLEIMNDTVSFLSFVSLVAFLHSTSAHVWAEWTRAHWSFVILLEEQIPDGAAFLRQPSWGEEKVFKLCCCRFIWV